MKILLYSGYSRDMFDMYEKWYAPKTWLAFYLLATTTVTGGEDLTATGDRETCKVEAGL